MVFGNNGTIYLGNLVRGANKVAFPKSVGDTNDSKPQKEHNND